ncbi:DUF6126 family protein [Streptomyces virginiae]|uniref:DUF6126 family protein n=1 Tax=Streptomyces virginiae TaxID=1961 RepID=UPI0036A628D4
MSQAQHPADPTATSYPTTPSSATTPAPAPRTIRARFESKFPRGLIIRLIAYLFVGHLFAFFVYLLFVLGGQNQ